MFTGKHLCWSLFLINMQAEGLQLFFKKTLRGRCFLVKFAKFLRTPFFTEHIWWLLLEISYEVSLYCIWEQWTVSFRGTYWLTGAYFILLCVCVSFLFISFFFFFFPYFFLWILLLFGFEASLSILKIKQWSYSWVSNWSFER